MRAKAKQSPNMSNEDAVHRYFWCIENKDIEGLLDLFDDDAILYEPFSKEQGLRGHFAIEPFLKVALMANSNLKRRIVIEKADRAKKDLNTVKAHITFEKGDSVSSVFTFEFLPRNQQDSPAKIKRLTIKFI